MYTTSITMLLLATLTLLFISLVQGQEDEPKIIHRDVCIIGGQAGGTYTALRLHWHNVSVALIEHTPFLGSSSPTYQDPETGLTLDYGPWQDSGGMYEFSISDVMKKQVFDYIGFQNPQDEEYKMDRLERENSITEYISKQGLNDSAPNPEYFDFFWGTKMALQPDGTPFGTAKRPVISLLWKNLRDQYREIIDGGFDLPDPVPKDLLQQPLKLFESNGSWTQLMNLWETCDGMSHYATQPILYSLKFCGKSLGEIMLDRWFLSASRRLGRWSIPVRTIQDFFQPAALKLERGNDLFLNTRVRDIVHTDSHIDVHIFRPGQEQREIIRAKKLVFSDQPSEAITRYIRNKTVLEDYYILRYFMDTTHLYSAVIKDNVFHPKRKFYNAPSLSKFFKNMPQAKDGIYHIGPAKLRNLRTVSLTSIMTPTIAEAKDTFLRTFRTLANFTAPDTPEPIGSDFEVMAINVISPYMRTFAWMELKTNPYIQLNKLQGLHKTWWVSPAFSNHILSKQWDWIEDKILPELLRPIND